LNDGGTVVFSVIFGGWSSSVGFARVGAMSLRVVLSLLCLLVVAQPVVAEGKARAKPAVFSGHVVRVIDGDTLVLDGDRRVRLLDINTPEMNYESGTPEPHAQQATDALRRMVFGQYVTVQTGRKAKDSYGRWLGHVYMRAPSGGSAWVNGTLVRDGYAHIYSFADNALYTNELGAYEAMARAHKRGLWSLPEWGVRKADDCCVREDIGHFRLVEGTIRSAAHVKRASGGRTYLNFGMNWKTDFTVMVADSDIKWFKKAGITDIMSHYKGKTVRVHGILQPVNGVQVRVTHPAQIEIMN
jgi:micrococcal nuclease